MAHGFLDSAWLLDSMDFGRHHGSRAHVEDELLHLMADRKWIVRDKK